MDWLHTWAGLLLGWVLYFMFLTGTLGYLDTEIDRWMMPELPMAGSPADATLALEHATAALEAEAPGAATWRIQLPVDRNQPYTTVRWRGAQDGTKAQSGKLRLDPVTGDALSVRDTGGGQALYRMHWQLHYLPRIVGEWIVGIATLCMFVALLTGVVIHRKLFADFFTFRAHKGQRSWLDAHNLTSVVSLPFQLMITYSGLLFMMFIYLPLMIAVWYGPGEEGRQVFFDEAFPRPAAAEASVERATLVELSSVYTTAQSLLDDRDVVSLAVQNPGAANARVSVRASALQQPLRRRQYLVFDGVTGELLAGEPPTQSGSKAARSLMLGLHEGLFARPSLRALYVLSGVLGAGMIGSGVVLWCVKRRRRAESRGDCPVAVTVVEKLNVAAVLGLPIAIGSYFVANRLLPVDLVNRAAAEMNVLFLVWGALFLHAALRSVAQAWREQSLLAALTFASLPLLNAMTTNRHLATSLPAGDWVLAGFDLTCLAAAVVFALIARHQFRARPSSIPTGASHTPAAEFSASRSDPV